MGADEKSRNCTYFGWLHGWWLSTGGLQPSSLGSRHHRTRRQDDLLQKWTWGRQASGGFLSSVKAESVYD